MRGKVKEEATHGNFLPRKFFVVKGKATDPISPLNAFDRALVKAGISQYNLVTVSSVLPAKSKLVKNEPLAPGTITYCVLAHMEGGPGETVGAGVGWSFGNSPSAEKCYGLVAEDHGYKDARAIREALQRKLRGMAGARELELKRIFTKVERMEVPVGQYGSVVAALVYVPW